MDNKLEHILLGFSVYQFLVMKNSLDIFADETIEEMYCILKNEHIKRKIT